MGLAIEVGTLAYWLNDTKPDEEGLEWLRKKLARINKTLTEAGLPEHHEPEILPARKSRAYLSSFSYSDIHYLRRAVAYARQAPEKFCPLPEGANPARDLVIDNELSIYMDSHFICHSDCEGFYVPIDFEEILYDDGLPGVMLGSSQQALAEIVRAAPLLGITLADGELSDKEASKIAKDTNDLGQYWIERQVWLTMYEVFRYSIAQGTVVMFT